MDESDFRKDTTFGVIGVCGANGNLLIFHKNKIADLQVLLKVMILKFFMVKLQMNFLKSQII